MKIALIGATGAVGSRLLAEALRRRHTVTAIARAPVKLSPKAGLTVTKGDATDEAGLAGLLRGHDVVFSAFNGQRGSPDYRESVGKVYQAILSATKKAGVKRLLVVGGAGSLEAAPGVLLVDTPGFPPEHRTEAHTFVDVLDMLRKESDLEWSLLSPAAFLAPGQRTGKFRLGGDRLLTDANGESRISMEDFAIAFLDEAERPRHLWRRFTVAY
jgi:putative NADH-flavin reductase